ncbi:MAG: RNA polymerase sigma factor SigX [Candidatus Dormibacteria bacterium]
MVMEVESITLSVRTSSQVHSGEPLHQDSKLPEPFERLFLAEYTRVVGIANRVLASRPEAEEVAQEVFLELHRHHPADAAYAAPWLHRAAWHKALNQLRSNRRRTSREEAVARPEIDATADPEGLHLEAAQRARVREAMSRLPRKSAAVLALRYSGLSYAEVAGAMNVSVGQVGTLLRRAEIRLRSEVQR